MTPHETWFFWLETPEGRAWSTHWRSLPVHATWTNPEFWARVEREAAQFERSHAAAKARKRTAKENGAT